jgi:hypothetical protein
VHRLLSRTTISGVEDKVQKEAVRIRRYLAMAEELRGALHSTEHFNVDPVIWFRFVFSNIRRRIIESHEQASGSGGGEFVTDRLHGITPQKNVTFHKYRCRLLI